MRIAVRLAGAIAAVLLVAPAAPASAADCASGSTSWIRDGGGYWANDENWSNGVPSAACDVFITLPGDYGLDTPSGTPSYARSLTIGGDSDAQTLGVHGSLHVGSGGITVTDRGTLLLDGAEVDTPRGVRLVGGNLIGIGSVRAKGGVFSRGGLVRVVTFYDVKSRGVISITGNYTQDRNATLDLRVTTNGNDVSAQGRLRVSGTAALAGTLLAELPEHLPGYLRIVRAGARVGTFDRTTVDGLPAHVGYDSAGVKLVRGSLKAPVLSRVRISPVRSGEATLRLSTSESSHLVVAFAQRQRAHRDIGGCFSGPPKGDQSPCVHIVLKKRLTGSAPAGRNRYALDLSDLPTGNYRVTLVATDEDGNRSKPVRVRMAVPPKQRHGQG